MWNGNLYFTNTHIVCVHCRYYLLSKRCLINSRNKLKHTDLWVFTKYVEKGTGGNECEVDTNYACLHFTECVKPPNTRMRFEKVQKPVNGCRARQEKQRIPKPYNIVIALGRTLLSSCTRYNNKTRYLVNLFTTVVQNFSWKVF